MRVKVLRIIARLNIGGPARNAVLLTQGLSHSTINDKYETLLVCGETANGEGDMAYLAREKGIEPKVVKGLGRELSVRNDWQAFWKIYRIICRERPDIIHTHTAKAGTLGRLAGMLYNVTRFRWRVPARGGSAYGGKGGRCKLVHTFHGHFFHSYFGKGKTLFFALIERSLGLFTDKIITLSESLKKDLVERFKIAPERKFSVVELGFELDELMKLPARPVSDCMNIGIVGRLVHIKNHKMLFRVADRLKVKGLRFKVKFLVVGDGELRQELKDYAKELGIEGIVEFKGWVRDLGEIYKDMDIVVLTSLNEGTPVSIIEAMAAARPVVATNVGGVPDIVLDGKSGYLVRGNDDTAFIDRLLDLINDVAKRKRFGEFGRESIKNRFLKERLILDTERLYRELLNNKR